MRYEIGYCSKTGNTERIALALKSRLEDQECILADIDSQEPTLDADVYLIGFCVRRHACPFKVLEWLEQLEGKTVVLYCTSALSSIPGYRERIEAQIRPFLPTDCAYMGLHLCPSSMTQEEFSYLEAQMTQNGKQENLPKLQQMYEDSLSHPDDKDIDEVIEFVREKLQS